jgi:hypothetical protein
VNRDPRTSGVSIFHFRMSRKQLEQLNLFWKVLGVSLLGDIATDAIE